MIRQYNYAIAIFLLALSPLSVSAQDTPRTYLCSGLNSGTIMSAPNWKAENDGFTGQSVLLEYRGSKTASHISWFKGQTKYHDGPALAMTMNGGISFVMFGEEFLESYVMSVSTMELLFTSIRSGSPNLPNAVKAYRGTCVPAGALSR